MAERLLHCERYTLDLRVASCTSLSGCNRVCWFSNKTWPFWRSPFCCATILAACVRLFTRFEFVDQDFSFTLITEQRWNIITARTDLMTAGAFSSPRQYHFFVARRLSENLKAENQESQNVEVFYFGGLCFESLLLLTPHPWYRIIQTIMNNWLRLASRTGFFLFIYVEVRSCAESLQSYLVSHSCETLICASFSGDFQSRGNLF